MGVTHGMFAGQSFPLGDRTEELERREVEGDRTLMGHAV